jgi:diguanylate cyclase
LSCIPASIPEITMRDLSLLQGTQGRTLGLDIIEQLSARNLSVSAENYELWLAYRLGDNNQLNRAIDTAAEIDQSLCDRLFEQHLAGARIPLSLAESGDSIARELAEIVACLNDAGEETRSYGVALNAAAALEAEEKDPALFRTMIRDLAAATRRMADHNQTLSAQIEQSSEQLRTMKTALVHVKAEALTDALTGVANRRCFEAALARHLAAPRHDGAGAALILCDIDHFKRINDTWGHPVGDQVIRFLAHVLSKVAPKDALVARYGGEEFAMIVPKTGRGEAAAIAESARQMLRAQRISKKSSGQLIGVVTASFGVAAQRAGDDCSKILQRADQRLYIAKACGRDQVVSEERAQSAA